MMLFISLFVVLFLSVSDIFFYRLGWLPAEPSFTLLPVFFIITLFNFSEKIYLLKYATGFRYFLLFLGMSILFLQPDQLTSSTYIIGNHGITFFLFISSVLFFVNVEPNRVFVIFLFSFAVLGGSILYDIFISTTSEIRGSGFAENPNNAALRIVFLLIGIMRFVERKWIALFFCLLTFLLVSFTLSRSGIITLVAVFFILFPVKFSNVRRIRNLPKRILFYLPIFGLLLFLLSQVVLILPDYLITFEHRAALERIEQIAGRGELLTDSDVEGGRVYILKDYFDLFLDNLIGYGTGYSINRAFYDKATHNMFLRFAIDYGIIGVISLIAFIYSFFRQSLMSNNFYMFILILAASIACFFTHSLFENRTFIIVLAFMTVEVLRTRNIQLG